MIHQEHLWRVARITGQLCRRVLERRTHASPHPSMHATGSVNRVYPDAFVRVWLLNGYHINTDRRSRLSWDYLQGEASVLPTSWQADSGKAWFLASSRHGYFDLGHWLQGGSCCAGYAHTYVYSPSAREVFLRIGSSDGVKVWLNGAVVWVNDTYRRYAAGEDAVEVRLAAGWNRLLVKVSQGRGRWAFSVAVCDSDGQPIPGVVCSPNCPPQELHSITHLTGAEPA